MVRLLDIYLHTICTIPLNYFVCRIPGHRIAYDKRVYQIGSHLHIEAVQRAEDVGDYVCIATSLASGAREASPPAKLSVICE